MIVRLSVVIGMRVVVVPVIRLPVVGVIVHVTVMAVFVFMHVLVKMMVVFVGVGCFPVVVFVGMLVSVLMPMNVLVFMFPLHNAPPFNIKFNPYYP
jgi:hypothetical protein